MLYRIYVNTLAIKENQDRSVADRLPPIVVRLPRPGGLGDEFKHCFGVKCDGPFELVYRPEESMESGASVWLETSTPLELIE